MAKYSSSTTPAVIAGLAVASTLLLAFLLRKTWWSASDRRNEQEDSASPERRAGESLSKDNPHMAFARNIMCSSCFPCGSRLEDEGSSGVQVCRCVSVPQGKKGTERFEDACVAVESAADGLPGASRLELYALYKQAIDGDCEEEEPSRLQAVARSKWAAWRAKRGVTSEEAKAAYVQLASDLGLLQEMQEDAREGRSGVGLLRRATNRRGTKSAALPLKEISSPSGRLWKAGWLETEALCWSRDDSLVNVTGEGRMTALHFAADRGFVDIVRLLIDRGADVNHTDDSGETPLHVAIAADQNEIVAMLIDAGADTSIKNNEGNSCAELLEQNKASKG
ncbi:hypothetical protein Emag_003249 [Eimeria magna]